MVIYEKKGRVAQITLDRPDRLNAVDPGMARRLTEIWADFRDDDDLWVGVLSGNGRSFCAGADISRMKPGGRWTLAKNSLLFGETKIGPGNYGIWKPLIAAVHGHVLGAGFYLAAECDLRVASEDAVFGLPEPRVGIPTLFAPFLRRFLTDGQALEFLLLGDRIDARRAFELGLVNRVVPRDRLIDTAGELARRLCENSPLALRSMKEVYHRSRGLDQAGALALMDHVFTPVMNSGDAVEGRKAFLEKRAPQWMGR